jgi:hypothetical protein
MCRMCGRTSGGACESRCPEMSCPTLSCCTMHAVMAPPGAPGGRVSLKRKAADTNDARLHQAFYPMRQVGLSDTYWNVQLTVRVATSVPALVVCRGCGWQPDMALAVREVDHSMRCTNLDSAHGTGILAEQVHSPRQNRRRGLVAGHEHSQQVVSQLLG